MIIADTLLTHGVAAEEIELIHLGLAERDNRVVIGDGILDNQAVRLGLGAENCCGWIAVARCCVSFSMCRNVSKQLAKTRHTCMSHPMNQAQRRPLLCPFSVMAHPGHIVNDSQGAASSQEASGARLMLVALPTSSRSTLAPARSCAQGDTVASCRYTLCTVRRQTYTSGAGAAIGV